jgi:Ca2+-binding EF-hand superfamily protein
MDISLLLHFPQINIPAVIDCHHRCNRRRTTVTVLRRRTMGIHHPLPEVMADVPILVKVDRNRCQDHLPLPLPVHLARTQLSGRSSKQLIKIVRLYPHHTLEALKLTSSLDSGQLSEKELRAALVNGDWSSFDPQTVKMMIRMFDTNRSGTIGFEEFCGLWGFLAAWRSLFDRFDTDKSGNIQIDEYTNALVAFGYRLSPQFIEILFRTYDKRGEGAISFDLFVQSCISLKRMTDVFKKYDDDRDGFITLSL